MDVNTIDTVTIAQGDQASVPPLIVEKLAKLNQITDEVLASFPYVQHVHGERRFSSFPVEATVRYLHALWMCDCKDMLLSVLNLGRRRKGTNDRFERYEGQRALELLCEWQEGQTANVISFLELKLNYAPFSQITQNLDEAVARGDSAVARRLTHGRNKLLNRTHNLVAALRGIVTVPPEQLTMEVRAACQRFGHTVEQCNEQLTEMKSPLYMYVPHPALARCNMLLMNALGVQITDNPADRPGRRTPRVQRPVMPEPGYAEHVVTNAITMVHGFPLQL
ncbi:MAG TPA: hypothetical protein VF040_03780 [Ktedonobacterales bacterium]